MKTEQFYTLAAEAFPLKPNPTSLDRIANHQDRSCFVAGCEAAKRLFDSESQLKKFFVREQYNTAHKNKLDTKIREAFAVFENKIITESQLKEFPDIHKKISADYYTAGGKCKAIDYSSSYTGAHRPTSSRKNDTVFVTEGYWLEVIEVKEG